MKSISTILSIVALVLVGVLFYFHISDQSKIKKVSNEAMLNAQNNFRIAYFDIDSLQEHYEYYKDVLQEMKDRESAMNAELDNMKSRYQKRINELQQKGPSMTQSEGEAAQREFNNMQQNYEEKKNKLSQDLQNHQMEKMKDLRTNIEEYLKEFNADKKYAYILSYEPGFIMYYKDSLYDITNEVIAGLNDEYKENKTSKGKK